MKNNSFPITCNIEIAYEIDGYPNHVIAKGGGIYNRKTRRKLKKTLNGGYTKGVWFGKKFITKDTLIPLLKKPEKSVCPF